MSTKQESNSKISDKGAEVSSSKPVTAPLRDQAARIIKRYAAISAGCGVIPVPFLDVTAIGGSQLLMVRSVAKLYGMDLSNDRVRAIVGTTIGSVGSVMLGGGLGAIVKTIPVVGTIAGAVTMPSIAGLTTLTFGNVLADHLESGGVLDELGLAKMSSLFKAEFQAARAKLSSKKHLEPDNPEALAV